MMPRCTLRFVDVEMTEPLFAGSDQPYTQWSLEYCLYQIQQSLSYCLINFPKQIIARPMRWLILVYSHCLQDTGNAPCAIQRRRVAGGRIRILRDEHVDYLSPRVGANHQAKGLSKIRRFRNSGRIFGDHNARRPFVFC